MTCPIVVLPELKKRRKGKEKTRVVYNNNTKKYKHFTKKFFSLCVYKGYSAALWLEGRYYVCKFHILVI